MQLQMLGANVSQTTVSYILSCTCFQINLKTVVHGSENSDGRFRAVCQCEVCMRERSCIRGLGRFAGCRSDSPCDRGHILDLAIPHPQLGCTLVEYRLDLRDRQRALQADRQPTSTAGDNGGNPSEHRTSLHLPQSRSVLLSLAPSPRALPCIPVHIA